MHPELVDARGLIKDADGNIVQYPFTKVFNRHENGTDIPLNHEVLAVDKINGFLAAVTWHNGDILVSTTGSLTSEHVNMAKEMLPLDKIREYYVGPYTFCFEIVHPNDPHIIPEQVGAYLIGARTKILGSPQMRQNVLDDIAEVWGVMRPDWFEDKFETILDRVKTYKREGYVVYDQESDTVLKLKTSYYLTSKFIARTKKLDLIFDRNYKQHFEEEFYSLCEHLQKSYSKEQFLEIPEQERLTLIRDWAEHAYV
jgi:hypothetical protein